ncbi:PQQ-like beta-propeller repeat protein, partial [candidate division WOR-3 bacterium]|nr:PQQ-like beta-propeller repeat protein [candidate division WOR-3 bacterium]
NGGYDTSVAVRSGETAYAWVRWNAAGAYQWKMRSALAADPARVSDWTEPECICVLPSEPQEWLSFEYPGWAMAGVPAWFSLRAEGHDNETLLVWVDFGDNATLDTWFVPPAVLRFSHTWHELGDYLVELRVRPSHGSVWALESTVVVVGLAGGVLWFAQPGGIEVGDSELVTTSPVVLNLGTDTVVVIGGCDDSRLYALKYSNGRSRGTGTPKVLDEGDFYHPAYCAATAHVVCGNEDGRLYAFSDAGLTRVWMWPEDTSDFHAWTPLAINGDKIYGAKENDTVYCIQDAGQNGSPIYKYYLRRVNMELTVPVIDNAGDVIFATESCFIYKMDPNLTSPRWTKQLQTSGEVHNLCLDASANIYATTDIGKVYCLNPADGEIRWTADVDPGRDAWYMAMGENNMLYVGTGSGKLVGVNYSTGQIAWTLQVSATGELDAGMVYTTKKYLYALDDEDWLYCIDVSGAQPALVWKVNCPAQIRQSGRSIRMTSDDNACLSLGPDGGIIVVGREFAFKVSGYSDGTLATTQWPKWQRDLYNTGKY